MATRLTIHDFRSPPEIECARLGAETSDVQDRTVSEPDLLEPWSAKQADRFDRGFHYPGGESHEHDVQGDTYFKGCHRFKKCCHELHVCTV